MRATNELPIRWGLRRLKRSLLRRPGRAVGLALAFAALAVVAAAGAALSRLAARTAALLGEESHVVAYLDPALDDERAATLAQLLARLPGVRKAMPVTSAEAAARLRAAAPAAAEALAVGLEPGFFPRSIELGLAPTGDLGALLRELEPRLRRLPGVAEVDVATEGIAQLERWQRTSAFLARALPVTAAALCAGLFLLVTSRARAGGAEEARALLHVGHTPWQVRWPAGLVGLGCGVIGGALGLAATSRLLGHAAALGLGPFAALPAPPPLAFAGRELAFAFALLAAAGLAAGLASQRMPERHGAA